MSEYERPYPQIYSEFEGKLLHNGRKRKYWIQDLTEEYYEDAVKYYTTDYMKDEPICKFSKAIEDPSCVKGFEDIWRKCLSEKLSLICLTKDENGKIQIAGFNSLSIHHKNDEELQSTIPIVKKVLNILKYFNDQRNIYEEFNCDKYLTALGLCVPREFRGEGIGEKLLCTRDQVAKYLGIRIGQTLFTSPISAKQAECAGMKDYVSKSYEELEKINKEFTFPGIQQDSKYCRLMYKIYDI